MGDPTTNGWTQYEKLVLSQLDELKTGLKEQGQQIAELHTTVALIAQTVEKSEDYDERIVNLETNLVTNDKLKTERRWILGTALAVIGSIAIPILYVMVSAGALG